MNVKNETEKKKEQDLKDKFAIDLKERIKDLCKEKGMTINELAERMGLGSGITLHTTIKKGNLRLVTLQRIADGLGVGIADLLSDGSKEEKARSGPVFHCPHCGKEVTITLGASLGTEVAAQ